ncbi:hypothetical protein PIB30_068928, partial [Stylosanthes scabra]|nr:hypothetical protein [Stylosanthes scabra]
MSKARKLKPQSRPTTSSISKAAIVTTLPTSMPIVLASALELCAVRNKGEDEVAEQEVVHSRVHHHHSTQVFYPPLLRPPAPLKNADGRIGGAALWMAYQGATIAGLVEERKQVCRLAQGIIRSLLPFFSGSGFGSLWGL